MDTMLTSADAGEEAERLIDFVATEVGDAPAFVLTSGGLDSDVVARLTHRAIGTDRTKLATVIQDDMNPRHLDHARTLAQDLGIELVELDLRGVHLAVIYRLAAGDPVEAYDPLRLLDPARMKCSLRTVVLSSYQDRGYVVIGTSNRTESELGFFLPFGDGLWHIGPIAHLYKTEVRLIAAAVGTASDVLEQPPSAGFWHDQTDQEDLGFWLVNRGPIQRERDFSDSEVAQAQDFSQRLDEAAVDTLLLALSEGRSLDDSPVPADIATSIASIVARSARFKRRPIGVSLDRRKQTK